LFDVTTLIAERRDDAQSATLPRERSMSYVRKNTAGQLTGGYGISTSGSARIFGATPSATATTGTGVRLEVPPYKAQSLGGSAPCSTTTSAHDPPGLSQWRAAWSVVARPWPPIRRTPGAVK
jgi:hypothetical protein